MEDKQILNASLIANEAINSMMRGKEKGNLCKLDVEKAYENLIGSFFSRYSGRWALVVSG